MATNSHQKVPHSHAVVKIQPSHAPWRGVAQPCSCHASAPSATNCNQPAGCPSQGEPMDAAWAKPATTMAADCQTALTLQHRWCDGRSERSKSPRRRGDFEPLHGPALGMQHGKVQARQRVLLAALGHVAHLMRYQASNGVEDFCRI